MEAASAHFQEVQVPSWLAKSSAEVMALRDGRVPGPDFTRIFAKTTARIAMRDGAELYTEIYRPLDRKEALPIIYVRSRSRRRSCPIRSRRTSSVCVRATTPSRRVIAS